MTDLQVGALVVAIWAGAMVPTTAPAMLLAGVGGLALLTVAAIAQVGGAQRSRHRVWLVVLLGAVAASLLAGWAWDRIDLPEPGRWEGEAPLLSDPEPQPGGVRVELELAGHRVDARAWGSAAGELRHRLTGERVWVEGTVRPLSDPPVWLRARRVTASLSITSVERWSVGQPHHRLANSIRRTIEAGAGSLDRDQRALLSGFVYGDDRFQDAVTADDFRAAGLTHLLAVSGQNVAFVLAVTGPLLRRFGYRGRFVLTMAVLGVFATVTRFEASVLRASAMTATAAVASLTGREATSRRLLGLAVAALLLLDPLLVHSVAFQLSVAASAGILLWSARLARLIRGPRLWAEALAVTASAQLAVAPLLVILFDGVPVASLPANIAAGPMAGPVMMWGLTAGLVAGWAPSGIAELLHLPTRIGIGYIQSVAALCARASLGELGLAHVAVLGAALALAMVVARRRARIVATVACLVTLLAPAVALAGSPHRGSSLDGTSLLWRDDEVAVLALSSGSRPADLLQELRRAGVDELDLVIARRGDLATFDLLGDLHKRYEIGAVWAPVDHRLPSATTPVVGTTIWLDGTAITVESVAPELVVSAPTPGE